MRIEFRVRRFPLTPALRSHAERRLHFALGRFGRRVRSVVVRFEDVNGPRGGPDKLCRLSLQESGGAPLQAEDVDADLYVAVDRAADRLGRRVARAIARQREIALRVPAGIRILGRGADAPGRRSPAPRSRRAGLRPARRPR